MGALAQIQRLLRFAVAAVAAYVGWIFLARYISAPRWQSPSEEAQRARAEFNHIYGGSEVKILQFYAREASVTEGESSGLCYGVWNARSVRIDPPVEGVWVSPNRCVPIAPVADTRYTLTAEGNDGRTVTASFLLPVRPDVATLPKISSFRIENHKPDYRGREVFLLSFSVQNAETVDIDPPAFPTLHGASNGRFYVAPERTTTYTLIVTGKRGHRAHQQLTVDLPAR